MHRKIIFTFSVLALSVMACAGLGMPQTPPTQPGPSATATPAPTRHIPPTTPPTQPAPHTPAPTFDLPRYLLTQAYAAYTPQPPATILPGLTARPLSSIPFVGSETPIPTSSFASVVIREPVRIANAVNTAHCQIPRVGSCTPTMRAGVTVYFTWTFGVQSSEPFSWGNAAVVATRDGKQILWTLVGNGLVAPPDKDSRWTLAVGDKAEFQAGLENMQPGHYTARLMMCRLSPQDCAAGSGWQEVGGERIDFMVTP